MTTKYTLLFASRAYLLQKGLRQGDPLSPILFNIVADMLVILIIRTKEDGQIGGHVPHPDVEVYLLQYAHDTSYLIYEV
jgi:hypothetical protein